MIKLGCRVRFEKEERDEYGHKAKKYNYLTDIKDLRTGDMIVVHARDSFAIAYFVEYYNIPIKDTTKWITDKVDTSAHYRRIQNQKRVEDIKEMLEAERNRTEELQIYEMLAKNNPRMQSLLEELKNLL